jgi:mannobiose 2-epimerase
MRAFLLIGFVCICFSAIAAEAPTTDHLRQQAQECRALLKTNLAAFYFNSIDDKNGGFKENLDANGHFTLSGEKFLTLQARQVWFFSALALENLEPERSLDAAKQGFNFIHEKMRDEKLAGYFSKVTDDGHPKDPRKHAYLNGFALYSFAMYYRASHDENALNAAKDLFETFENYFHDEIHGGYIEFFNPDWTEVREPGEGGYVGALGQKTYNTHLHIMEAMAELYRNWQDPRVLRRLQELLVINTETVLYPRANNNVDAYQRDWTVVNTPQNLRASYGHDVECIWLVMDAAKTAGQPASIYRSWSEKLADTCLKFGLDREHGGFYESGSLNEKANQLRKTWWVQNEAMVGMLDLYQRTGKEEYYDAFASTFDFCKKFQIAKEGGWWAERNADGSPSRNKARSNMWQGAYHAGRSLIECAHRLDDLAAKMK